MVLNLVHQPLLELEFVLEPLVLDALLAFRTDLPIVVEGLVAADVDERVGEQLGHFGEDVLVEGEYTVVAGAHDGFGRPVGTHGHGVGIVVAGILRIGGEDGAAMAGDFDFGDDVDVAGGGVAHDVADLLLGVEAAVGHGLVRHHRVQRVPGGSLGPPRAHAGELRILVDLHAPAVVVGEVPVELVDLEERQHVDVLLHEGGVEEVARHVEMGAAVAEARVVGDLAARHCEGLVVG